MLLKLKFERSVFGCEKTNLYCLLSISVICWGPLSKVLPDFSRPIFLFSIFISIFEEGLSTRLDFIYDFVFLNDKVSEKIVV